MRAVEGCECVVYNFMQACTDTNRLVLFHLVHKTNFADHGTKDEVAEIQR